MCRTSSVFKDESRLNNKSLNRLFEGLWQSYTRVCSDAEEINALLSEGSEDIINDHIAFRTFDLPGINLEAMASIFTSKGYVEKGSYNFEEKKLNAKHYEHPDGYPKIFISELRLNECSEYLREYVKLSTCGLTVDENLIKRIGMDNLLPVKYEDYLEIKEESEYASWLLIWGFIPNHFTVDINSLSKFDEVKDLNKFLLDNGFDLNDNGGFVKGSPENLLEQSSTMSMKMNRHFAEDVALREVPGCYYEFAKRYVGDDGEMFEGFIAKSADKIFESTNSK
jgi:hypothetical protein